MIPAIEEHRAELADLCRLHHVLRLSLFGSATRDDFDPQRSDLDFAVAFESLPPGEHAAAYIGLIEGYPVPVSTVDRPRRVVDAAQPVPAPGDRGDAGAAPCRGVMHGWI